MAQKKITNLSSKLKDKEVMRSEWWDKYRIDEDDTVFNALKHMEEIIEKYKPENAKGFTGGYVQRLSSDNTMVLYYGHDKNRNTISENLKIPEEQFEYICDIFHIYMFYFQKYNKPTRKVIEL
jgi:hypothetical protein